MKKHFLILILFLLAAKTKAQWNQDTMVRNPITVVPYSQNYPVVCRDGSRGYYIGWWHYDGNVNTKPQVQRVDSAGYLQWQVNGKQVPGSFNIQNWLDAVVSDDSGGVVVGWHNQVSLSTEIRVQRMDENGASLWGPNSVVVYGNIANQHSDWEKFVTDNRGGIISTFSWNSQYIYAQRIDKYGNKAWGNNPVAISSSSYKNYALISDGKGGIFSSYVLNTFQQHVQHVDSSGNLLWGSGINLGIDPSVDGSPICSDGNGGVFVTFDTVQTNGIDWDVYFHHVDSAGNIVSPSAGYPIAASGMKEFYFYVMPDNQGGMFAVYTLCLDSNCAQQTIIAKRISATGAVIWADTACSEHNFEKRDLKMCSDGMGGFICTWFDYRPIGKPTLYSQRYDMNGNRLWFNWGYPVSASPNLTQSPLYWQNMVTADAGAAVVVWTDTRTATVNGENVYMARIDGALPTGIAENPANILPEIFPNPSSGNFTITFSEIIKKGTVEIFNALGENVFTNIILNTSEIKFSLKNISGGIYFVKVFDGEKCYCKKLIVKNN